MRNRQLWVAPVVLLAATVLGRAQGAAPTKLGIIHIQNAIVTTKEGQKSAAELDVRVVSPKSKELERKQSEIQGLQAQLQKGGSVLSEDQKTKLVRDIDAKTKSFTYGSAGAGTGPQIGAEYFFKEVAKVNYVHVPFQGGAPAITATLGNHVDSLVLTLPPVAPQIRSGALRGIGVASDKRNSAIPDVPTYGDMGYPNVYSQSWVGFFAPAKTPDAVVQKLNTEINALMKEPDSLEKIAKAGFDPVVKNVAETSDYFKSEVASWGKMVNAIGFSN